MFEINENLKAQEEAFFQRWLKVREAKGIPKTMGRGASQTPLNKEAPPMQPVSQATAEGGRESGVSAASGVTPKTRKTKELI
jgi:hypothetical protein